MHTEPLPPDLQVILDDALANLSDDLMVIRVDLLAAASSIATLARQIDALDDEIWDERA